MVEVRCSGCRNQDCLGSNQDFKICNLTLKCLNLNSKALFEEQTDGWNHGRFQTIKKLTNCWKHSWSQAG